MAYIVSSGTLSLCSLNIGRSYKEQIVCTCAGQLEELKTKDHQLALLDRNQYPDRGIGLQPVKLMLPADCKDQDTTGTGQARTRKSNKAVQHDGSLQV